MVAAIRHAPKPGGPPWKMSMRTTLACLLATLLAALVLPAAAGRVADEPVRIAGIYAVSGLAAEHNRPSIRGAELAATVINASGGLLGRPLELIILDNHSTPLGAKQAAEEAVSRGVSAVVGPVWSSHSLAAAPVLQAVGIPMVTPMSTNPQVTAVGDCIFRVCYTDYFQGRVMARFAREELKAARAAVLSIVDEDYSLELGQVFAAAFAELGGAVVWQGGYRAKAVDFTAQLRELAKADPEVVSLPGYGRDASLIIRQARGFGLTCVFLGGDGWSADIFAQGGEGLAGNYYSTFWHPGVPYPRSAAAQAAYRRYYGSDGMDIADVYMSYDAVMVVADAVSRAGSAAPAVVRQALSKTRGFAGATGTLTFDARGDPVGKGAVILRTEQDGPHFMMVFAP